MIEKIETFFLSFDGAGGYAFLFISSLAENLCPPLPGDTMVVLGGILAGKGHLDFWPAYSATTAGSILGFMILFFAGRKLGTGFFQKRLSKVFNEKDMTRVNQWLERYGYSLVMVNRFMAGFRAVVSICVGIARMNTLKVFLLASLSCMLWNAGLMALGIWVGENWASILRHYQFAVSALILIALFIAYVKLFHKKRKVS